MTLDPKIAFRNELDRLRGTGYQPGPMQIAQAAVAAGAPITDSVEVITNHMGYDFGNSSSHVRELLRSLVQDLCSNAERILEVPAGLQLTTAGILDKTEHIHITYFITNVLSAEAAQLLLPSHRSSVVGAASELQESDEFQAIIIVTPPTVKSVGRRHCEPKYDATVLALVGRLAQDGMLLWLTAHHTPSVVVEMETICALESLGFAASATIDLAPGWLGGTTLEGKLTILQRGTVQKRLSGRLQDVESSRSMASAYVAGSSSKPGPCWIWLESSDPRLFRDIENESQLKRLVPRGNQTWIPLETLLVSSSIVRADKPVSERDETAALLYVPEYAGSNVTTNLEDQTVTPKAVYRLAINPEKANADFVARLLNSGWGREARRQIGSGSTIQRIPAGALLKLRIPLPSQAIQSQIARAASDVRLIEATLKDARQQLDQNWTNLPDLIERLDALKAVFDLERQIADWWRELPYPLAAIYRRYQFLQSPRDRFEALLHFFEMTAVYLAALGTSYVRALRKDWKEVIPKWLHPSGGAGIERTDIGFWIGLARASLKDTKRIISDNTLYDAARELSGPELARTAAEIGSLAKATDVLDVARRQRNSWKGHGGHLKDSDAAKLEGELQQAVRDLFEITAPTFRRVNLVRPGSTNYADGVFKYEVERLVGSDPTFQTQIVELDSPIQSNSLAFWVRGTRRMCAALPFFRLGMQKEPRETSVYVFNRVEEQGYRWISYQEAKEQEVFSTSNELRELIELKRQ